LVNKAYKKDFYLFINQDKVTVNIEILKIFLVSDKNLITYFNLIWIKVTFLKEANKMK